VNSSVPARRVLRLGPSGRICATLRGEGSPALLLLPPLGEERKGCVRPLVDLAGAWAAGGGSALLFDFAGTGDAAGDSPSDWASLLEDASAALDALASVGPIRILGARIGGRLALELASARSGIEGICLWEPVCDCAAWLRESRRRSAFRGGAAVATDKGERIDGFLFGSRLIADLESRISPPPAPACPVRILSIDPRGNVTRPAVALAASLGVPAEGVRIAPFWLETEPFDTAPLLGPSLAALGRPPCASPS